MTREEDLVRATASAIAETVRDVPPLRLRPADDERTASAPRSRRAHRLRGWLAPVAAAAAVLALAVSLVIIRDLPNGRVVPATGPTSAFTGGVPEYYVKLNGNGTSGTANGLLIGDTFTGAQLAAIAPPQGFTFLAVTGAGDDRTFVAEATGFRPGTAAGGRQPATWYLLTLAPGSSSPARLTRLPLPATMPSGSIKSVALSQDGRELALAYVPNTRISLRIYSVATGKLLNSWSASDSKPPAIGLFANGFLSNTSLSWVDDDRALAFATSTDNRKPAEQDLVDRAVRVLDVTARGGDLIADSRVVWSRTDTSIIANYTRPVCNAQEGSTVPFLTADGKTVVCAAIASLTVQPQRTTQQRTTQQRTELRLVWLGFSLSAPEAARALYQFTASVNGQGLVSTSDVRWVNASGSAMIVDWAAGSGGPNSPPPAHFGVVHDGRFTPLPSPPGSNFYTLVNRAAIAW
jgi:hypothetical protein